MTKVKSLIQKTIQLFFLLTLATKLSPLYADQNDNEIIDNLDALEKMDELEAMQGMEKADEMPGPIVNDEEAPQNQGPSPGQRQKRLPYGTFPGK